MNRWVTYAALLGLGFAGGVLHFRSVQAQRSGDADAGGQRSLKEWAERQPGDPPAAGEKPPRDAVAAAIRAKRGGLGSTMRSHVELVRETPVTELPALLLRYEVMMPGADSNSLGGLMRDAIVERLLAEDPEALLELALGGRSEHIGGDLRSVVGGLREHLSFEALERKAAAGGIPAVKIRVMEALLSHEIDADPERGWALALANGRVDIDRLAQINPGPEVIEKVILGDSRYRLSDAAIELCFATKSGDDPVATLGEIGSIAHAHERIAAIRGAGAALGSDLSPEAMAEVADGLRSDQERWAFYHGSLSAGLLGSPWADGGVRSRYLENVLAIDRPYVRQALLDYQLREWKIYAPDEAQSWAEENDQLERFESLQVAEFPIVPHDLEVIAPDGEFDFPVIPAGSPFAPPGADAYED